MAFRLLGVVEVNLGGQTVELGPPQQRTVLAALVVDAGNPVSLATLTQRVWGDEPPAGARASLYAHLTRIRRIVERPADPTITLGRGAGGYVLGVDPERVDLHRFRRLARAANLPGTPDSERAALLGTAVALWRGAPFTGTSGQWAERVQAGLVRERLDAVAQWAALAMLLDRPVEVVSTVRELVTEHPLAEPLVAALMRALAATGRPAESLELFAATRARLADELGADPGSELRAVHELVLRGGVAPAAPPKSIPAPRRVPAQLPADVYAFTGRDRELATLDDLLTEAEGTETAVVLSAVSGTAGVGKTSLALRWAHRVRDRFPDGQLYVDLRGYDTEQPLSDQDALARFLGALGLTGGEIPLDPDDRAARYRTELSGRRMLVLLDNASTVDQVRPLLPGSPGCLVVVTSRDSLAGLVARHGARRLDLDLLPLDDAIRLLTRLIGDRVAAEPDAAVTLAEECARLPLALRIAAELAAARPMTPLSDLVDELADEQRRLEVLDAGLDPRTAVRAVFSWSYQHLTDEAATAFRLFGLHPGQEIDPYAAAALGDHNLPTARRLLDLLARVHLIEALPGSRYVMHDLLRAYANELAESRNSVAERRSSLTRLLDFYLSTAAAAMNTLHPAERHRRPDVAPPTSAAPELATDDAAKSWLDAERANLVAACVHGHAHGWRAHTVGLANTLFRYFDDAGLNTEALTIHNLARDAAAELGDGAGEARAWLNLGLVYWHQGLLGEAAAHLQRALGRYAAIGDEVGLAGAHNNLGVIEWRQGNLTESTEHLREALRTYRRLEDLVGEADALGNLGLVYEKLDHLELALDHHQQALALFQRVGYRIGEAYALNDLGTVHTRLGRTTEAVEELSRALAHFQEIGGRAGEAETLNRLGEALRAGGPLGDAVDRHAEALAVAVEIGDRYEQARAHAGIAEIHESTGHPDQAREHWQLALDLYTGLGVPDAETARTRLAALRTEDYTVGL